MALTQHTSSVRKIFSPSDRCRYDFYRLHFWTRLNFFSFSIVVMRKVNKNMQAVVRNYLLL